jgi:hypothetical protein
MAISDKRILIIDSNHDERKETYLQFICPKRIILLLNNKELYSDNGKR